MSEQSQKVIRRDAPANHLDIRERRRLRAIAKVQGLSKQDAQKIIVYLDALLKDQFGPQ